MAGSAAAHAAVKRELLVRYLDAWAPAALHGARKATFVLGYAVTADESAVAALRGGGEPAGTSPVDSLAAVQRRTGSSGLAVTLVLLAVYRRAQRALVAGRGHTIPLTGAPYNECLEAFLVEAEVRTAAD